MDDAPTAAPSTWPYNHKPLSEVPEPPWPPSVRWSADMIDALKRYRSDGKSYIECAELIGVAIGTIADKCKAMRINAKPRYKQRTRIKG